MRSAGLSVFALKEKANAFCSREGDTQNPYVYAIDISRGKRHGMNR